MQYLLIATALTCPSKPVWEARPFGYAIMLKYDEYTNMGHEKLSLRVIVPSAVTVLKLKWGRGQPYGGSQTLIDELLTVTALYI